MKKMDKKLSLNRETLRHLDARELTWVHGDNATITLKGCQTDSCQTCQATHCDTTDPVTIQPATMIGG